MSEQRATYQQGCVCDLRLPCGVHLREQQRAQMRGAAQTASGRSRNTEGLRGHANARKRACD